MHKGISVFCLLSIAASLMAAPTANEDFVVAEDAKTFTNAVDAAKEYTDGKIAAIDVGVTSVNGMTGDVTISGGVGGGSGGVNTNDVKAIIEAEVGGTNALKAAVAAVPNKIDKSGGVLDVDAGLTFRADTPDGVFSKRISAQLMFTGHDPVLFSDFGGTFTLFDWYSLISYDLQTLPDYLASGSWNTSQDPFAKMSQIPDSADDVGAFGAAAGASLQTQVATIGAHLNAEDARFVVTNYNSVAHTPEAYVEIKLPDNSWSRIWSEMTRWNWLTGTYLPGNFYTQTAIDAKLAEKADRAWGFYDSTTGAFAPDGYTWISSPKIAIAANLAYQRTVTTEGAIWVLESNGAVTETGGMTNGFFRISDDEGNSLFEIVKGNKRTVGADAASCQTVAGFTPTKLQIGYSIVSDDHPMIYVCRDLTTQDWKAEDDADCVANVSWSGSSGAWVAQVQAKSAYSSLFVKATYEVGGETYISNSAPVSMQYLMLGGVKYAVGTATISGHTVLTLTVAP